MKTCRIWCDLCGSETEQSQKIQVDFYYDICLGCFWELKGRISKVKDNRK